MNQSNIISLRIGGAAIAGDVVGIRRDASVVKMDHVVGPILGADIDNAGDSFTFAKHGLVTGDEIQYQSGSGVAVTGLSDADKRFAIVLDENTFQVATTLINALAGTDVAIAAATVGGDTHTFAHQVVKEKAVGVVLHDVDASQTGTPVAIQLFNHGVFVANTKGGTTVNQGDILEVVDDSSLLQAGTTTSKGLALDRLPEVDFAAYSIAAPYAIGDTCTSGGNKVCVSANGAGAFSAADWVDLTGNIRVLSL
jgi:hypothetical protein